MLSKDREGLQPHVRAFVAGLKGTVRTPNGTLEIRGATTNNLRDVDVDIPLGCWSS
jgi:excinuclease UvrABC ATPase subunit